MYLNFFFDKMSKLLSTITQKETYLKAGSNFLQALTFDFHLHGDQGLNRFLVSLWQEGYSGQSVW